MADNKIISTWYGEALRGNKSCFNSLITYYHAQLLSYALRICGYSDIAEDALQDAYIIAFTRLHEVKEPENFYYWLRTIVKRSCWQQLKGKRNMLPLSAKLIDSKIADEGLEREIEKNNLNEFLRERINRLSGTLKTVVLLRYFTDYNDYDNISEILNIPVGTVRSRLNEAKKQLKKIWSNNLSGMPDEIRRESDYWNEFYWDSIQNLQTDTSVRGKFINHFAEELSITFTGGKSATGRNLIEKEFEDDLNYGTSYGTGTVFNLKDIGILQGENINPKEYPDRCPPTSTLIFHRQKDKTIFLQFHNAFLDGK